MKYGSECRRVGAYDREVASLESGIDFDGQVSRTQQSQAADTDINVIVKRFKVTGLLPQGVRAPSYGDFENLGDFRSALDAIMAAEKSFAAMPAEIRHEFQNDPGRFVAFCSDPANVDRMRELGLAVPLAPKPDPIDVRVLNPDTGEVVKE